MSRYEVQLFNSDDLLDVVDSKKCDSIIQALDRFTDMCEAGREDYNLDDYYVWLYDRQNNENILYYSYVQDDDYGTYEELVPCRR